LKHLLATKTIRATISATLPHAKYMPAQLAVLMTDDAWQETLPTTTLAALALQQLLV